MNKILTSLAIAFFSFNSFALVADVEPIAYPVSIEGVEAFQPLVNVDGVVINLVQVNNGGSTNVSSLYLPSSIYLTFFVKGEVYDTTTSYKLYGNAKKFYGVVYDEKSKMASFLVEVVDHRSEASTIETLVRRVTIYLGAAIDEAQNQQTEKLTSAIGFSDTLAN